MHGVRGEDGGGLISDDGLLGCVLRFYGRSTVAVATEFCIDRSAQLSREGGQGVAVLCCTPPCQVSSVGVLSVGVTWPERGHGLAATVFCSVCRGFCV